MKYFLGVMMLFSNLLAGYSGALPTNPAVAAHQAAVIRGDVK